LSKFKNSKNQNLNKLINKGKNGGEKSWQIILYSIYYNIFKQLNNYIIISNLNAHV